jgi:hypothetical protein
VIGQIERGMRGLRGPIDTIEVRETRGQIEVIAGKEADTTEEIGAEIAAETEEAIEITEGDKTAKSKKKIHTSTSEERSKKSARPTPKRPNSSKPSSRSA